MASWLALIVVGLIVYCITLAPVFPPAWKPLVQALGGILIVVGLVILVLLALGIEVATGQNGAV
jgi:hypothetical protein